MKSVCVCKQSFEGERGMNEFVCLLMFVFCVCLKAVVLSDLFVNMLVHEWQPTCSNVQAAEMQQEGEVCQEMSRHMRPLQKGNPKYTNYDLNSKICF